MTAAVRDEAAFCRNCGADGPGWFVWVQRKGSRQRKCVSCTTVRRQETAPARAGCAIRSPGDSEVHRSPRVDPGASQGPCRASEADPLLAILCGAEDGKPVTKWTKGVFYGA